MPEDTKPTTGEVDSSSQDSQDAKPDPMSELKSLIGQLKQSQENLKHEFNRKIDSLKPPPPPAPARKSTQELMYEDPEQAVRQIEEEVETRITRKLEARDVGRQTVERLYSDYPELKEASNPLSTKANEIFSQFSEAEQKDPRTMRTAVYQAAAELGLAPKPKRKQVVEAGDDNFQLGGGKPAPRKKGGEVDQSVLEAAAAFGLNVEDPKVVARLKQRADRPFKKYQ